MQFKHALCASCFRNSEANDYCTHCRLEEGKAFPSFYIRHGLVRVDPTQPPVTVKLAVPGSSADYYVLPASSTQLQDLIAFKNMNAQLGEIFRAAYRYGQCPHSNRLRELNKIIFYAEAELNRLSMYAPEETK